MRGRWCCSANRKGQRTVRAVEVMGLITNANLQTTSATSDASPTPPHPEVRPEGSLEGRTTTSHSFSSASRPSPSRPTSRPSTSAPASSSTPASTAASYNRSVELAGAPALALVLLAERFHDRDEIVVADLFQLADRPFVRLLVRLRGDQVDQFVVELPARPSAWSTAISGTARTAP